MRWSLFAAAALVPLLLAPARAHDEATKPELRIEVAATPPELPAWGSPWPSFQRGDLRQGRSDAPAITSPKIRWAARVGIQGYLNSPVIAGPLVIVTSSGRLHNRPDELDGVWAVNRETGRVVWHHHTGLDACGITYAAGRIFTSGDDGVVRVLRADDGTALWRAHFSRPVYGHPLVVHDQAIVPGPGATWAFDTATGAVRWRTSAVGDSRGAPASDGVHVFVVSEASAVVCLDLQGNVVWKARVPGESYSAPTLLGEYCVVGWADSGGGPSDAPLVGFRRSDGKQLWAGSRPKKPQGPLLVGNLRGSPAVHGNWLLSVFAYGNTLCGVDADGQQNAWWVAAGARMFPAYGSPVIATDTAYIARTDGSLHAIDVAKREHRWSYYLGAHELRGESPPADLLDYQWRDFAWKTKVGKSLYATPALDTDGTIYVGTGDGWLYAIGE